MKGFHFNGLGRLFAALVIISALFVPFSTVFAGGNGAQTFTQNFHNATDSFVQPISCLDTMATVTITYNGVLHYTVNKAGDFWATGTQTGTASVVPLDPSLPTYSGHFTTWFGTSDNQYNSVEHSTFSAKLTGSDGSVIRVSETMHLSTNANGDLVVSFDKLNCH